MYRQLITFSFIALIFGGAFGAMCPSTTLTDSDRATMVNKHNSLRTTLARGQAPSPTGYAPAGKNIYKLQWDCALEASAQAWANMCKFEHSTTRNNVGENLMMIGGTQSNSALLIASAENWWGELLQYGLATDASNTFTPAVFDRGVGHFTQMAWGNTKKLGCGIAKCSGANIIVCHYGPAGNYLYEPIYQPGAACRQNSDCTTYGGSTCSVGEGLCVDPAFTDVPTGTIGANRCPGTETEQPSRAFCLTTTCTEGYTCKYSAVASNYVCCAVPSSQPTGQTDCTSTNVLMYSSTMPAYCPTLGRTGQCPDTFPFCVYSSSWRQNVCCKQNIGK